MNKKVNLKHVSVVLFLVMVFPTLMLVSMIGHTTDYSRRANLDEMGVTAASRVSVHNVVTFEGVLVVVGMEVVFFVGVIGTCWYDFESMRKKGEEK